MKPWPRSQMLSQKLCTLNKEEEVVAEGVEEDVEPFEEEEDVEPPEVVQLVQLQQPQL